MSAQLKLETWSEQEYWAYEEKSEVKHEFINGVPYAMAGGTLKSHSHLFQFGAACGQSPEQPILRCTFERTENQIRKNGQHLLS